jgi:NUMOD1 domain
MFGKPKPEGSGTPSQQISVLDTETNLATTYDSIGAAARALKISKGVINIFFARNQQNSYKGRYIFKKL